MAIPNRPLRLLFLAALALIAAALLWLLIDMLRGGVALWQQLRELPLVAQYFVAALIAVGVLGIAWLGWRVLRPRPRKPAVVEAPQRGDVDARLDTLARQHADTTSLHAELAELDRRARSHDMYVAVFGEISAGKSSLIRALAPQAAPQADVLGGTTREVAHYHAELAQTKVSTSLPLTLADMPGTHEVAGSVREQIARDEALRAHIVLYVCAGDLTRDQDAELRWLRGFGKPLVLVLNKTDQLRDDERATLQATLRERYRALTDAQVVISAGGSEPVERHLADGRSEFAIRQRDADVGALSSLLMRYAARSGTDAFEPAREAAVLATVNLRADVLAAEMRGRESNAIVDKYTKRAVVGALAAVLPGSDLVIQAVLATGLIRELSKLYEVPVRDIDIEGFVSQVKLTVRTSASLVLAIAGNAAKAFPGLGTLGGGVMHAIAYGLIFDSLGRAVATTLRDHKTFDQTASHSALTKMLADNSAERLRRIAAMAISDKGE